VAFFKFIAAATGTWIVAPNIAQRIIYGTLWCVVVIMIVITIGTMNMFLFVIMITVGAMNMWV
jgi:hypothetical protein